MSAAGQFIFYDTSNPTLGLGVHYNFSDLIAKFIEVHGNLVRSFGLNNQGYISGRACYLYFSDRILVVWKSTVQSSNTERVWWSNEIRHTIPAWTREEVDPTFNSLSLWLVSASLSERERLALVVAQQDRVLATIERMNAAFLQALQAS